MGRGESLPIAEPRPEQDHSKSVVRVRRSLHRRLVGAAGDEGVRLNQLVNVPLAQGLQYPEPSPRPARTAPQRLVPDPHSITLQKPAPIVLQEEDSPYLPVSLSLLRHHPQNHGIVKQLTCDQHTPAHCLLGM